MRAELARVARDAAAKAAASAAAPKVKPVEPTQEQRARAHYELEPTTNRGQVIGHAWRKQPWFETLRRRGGLSAQAVKALWVYRNAFEGSFYSEMRCALDRGDGGGAGGNFIRLQPFEVTIARQNLQLCESGIGSPLIDTLRAIGLHDLTFADVAVERFGHRLVDYIEAGKSLQKKAPKSGRHREVIRQEFDDAVAKLVENVTTMERNER